MIDKNTITDYLSNAKQKASDNAIVFTPGLLFGNESKNKFGSIFMFERFGQAGNNTYRMTSSISKHYMEDNVSMQDHWAIDADTYILSGYIGEVVYTPPKKWANAVETYVTDYLKPLSILSPVFDSYTQSALNVVQAVESSFRRYEQIARNIYDSFTNNTPQRTNQSYIAQILKSCQLNRQLITVWTPFKTFENMAIVNVTLTQEDSKYKSRIEVELQQWRKVSKADVREATKEEKKAYLAYIQKMREQDAGLAATQEVSRGTQSTWFKFGSYVYNYINKGF